MSRATISVSLPAKLIVKLEDYAENNEFEDRSDAIETLIRTGIDE